MAIPDFQTIMLPLLQFLGDEKEHSLREIIDALALYFKLSEEEKNELLPSGNQSRFANRVSWARSYLGQSGLLENIRRGVFKITERGIEVLKQSPPLIDRKFLERFPEYVEFQKRESKSKTESLMPSSNTVQQGTQQETPIEALESGYLILRENLARELLDKIKKCSPSFFERLVVDLLVKMGYGGSVRDAGSAIGGRGDEGIDGVIKEDRLGLDMIYLQAKRWEATVGRPEIQKFAGALQGQRAKKGVFITTSDFSRDALEFAKNIDSKIVLIDGEKLAQLMIDFNLGVSNVAVYEVKKIDSDYFEEE
ncbi:MAG: restriction endonuclease [Nitrospinae bacterium]|nr:restriction endonuclease [Nitrospinota bacterium]